MRNDRIEFIKLVLFGLCAGAIIYLLRLVLVNFEGTGHNWFTTRILGIFVGLCTAATVYILSNGKWLGTAIALTGMGLTYGLGISGREIYVSSGSLWDVQILWYYLDGRLSTSHTNYDYYVTVAYVSLLGSILTIVGGVLTLSLVERSTKELKPSSSHDGTNKYRSNETVFGDANWGDWDKIKKTVSDPAGIVLGEHYDPRQNKQSFSIKDPKTWGQGGTAPLITMSSGFEGGHSIIYSGTGGGKTAGVVYPTMLTYKHPIIAVDPQHEVYETMHKARKVLGFEARVIERWNGIDLINMMRPYFLKSDLAYVHLADALAEPQHANTSDAGRHFTGEASTLIAGLLKHIIEDGSKTVFQDLSEAISLPENDLKKHIDDIISDEATCHATRGMLASYKQMDTRTFTGLQSTVKQALKWAAFKELNSVLGHEDGDQPPLLGPNTDVYIRLTLEDIKSFPTIIRQILGTILYIINQEQDGVERLMIVDEAYQIGKLKAFENVRDTMRKRGLHLMQIFQSTGQIEELYGRAGVKAWRSSTAAIVYSTIADPDEAEQVSKMIGQYTVNIQGQSKSNSFRGFGIGTPSSSTSKNSSLQQARLIRPEQLHKLPNDGLIIFLKGQSPIVCGKAFSFRRKEWQKYTPFIEKS